MGLVAQSSAGARSTAEKMKRGGSGGEQRIVGIRWWSWFHMGDLTDELIAPAHEVGSNLPDREMDMLLTTGNSSQRLCWPLLFVTWGARPYR